MIFTNSNSKAGKYYNQFTLDFIEKTYQRISNINDFDIIESIKENFIEISKDIFEQQKSFKKEEFELNDNLLKLNCSEDIKLRECFILGFLNLKMNIF